MDAGTRAMQGAIAGSFSWYSLVAEALPTYMWVQEYRRSSYRSPFNTF